MLLNTCLFATLMRFDAHSFGFICLTICNNIYYYGFHNTKNVCHIGTLSLNYDCQAIEILVNELLTQLEKEKK